MIKGARSVNPLLAAIARRRGFLWCDEVGTTVSDADKADNAVPVVDDNGEAAGWFVPESEDVTCDALVHALNTTPMMAADQREAALDELDALARVVLVDLEPLLAGLPDETPPDDRAELEDECELDEYDESDGEAEPDEQHDLTDPSRRAVAAMWHAVGRLREASILKEAGTGDQQAIVAAALRRMRHIRSELLTGNLRLIAKQSTTRWRRNLRFEDLLIAGAFGLLKSVDRFEVSRGLQLSTYAVWWIRQSIWRAIADHGAHLRIPVHVQASMALWWRATAAFWRCHGRSPTRVELTQFGFDLTEHTITKSLAMMTPVATTPRRLPGGLTSIDMILEADSHSPACLFAGPTSIGRLAILQRLLAPAFIDPAEESLTPSKLRKARRYVIVLVGRWGIGHPKRRTLEELGREFGVTRERIRQIESKARQKERHRLANTQVMDEVARALGPDGSPPDD